MEKTFVSIKGGEKMVCFEERYQAISFAIKLRRLVDGVSVYEENMNNGGLKLMIEF